MLMRRAAARRPRVAAGPDQMEQPPPPPPAACGVATHESFAAMSGSRVGVPGRFRSRTGGRPPRLSARGRRSGASPRFGVMRDHSGGIAYMGAQNSPARGTERLTIGRVAVRIPDLLAGRSARGVATTNPSASLAAPDQRHTGHRVCWGRYSSRPSQKMVTGYSGSMRDTPTNISWHSRGLG